MTTFRNELEAIVNQMVLESTIDEYHRLALTTDRRPNLLMRMLRCLKHPMFSAVLFSKRCPLCKGHLCLSNVDKGAAFVCGRCGETEELFMRHVRV